MPHNIGQWTANVHYHPLILNAVPPSCNRALDVGCGQGALSRSLRALAPKVTGIDTDARSIEIARSYAKAGDISYIHGDFLATDLPAGSFDMVTAVASLHHMDATAALERMDRLLRPGGVLAVIGLARNDTAMDFALSVPAAIGKCIHRLGGVPDLGAGSSSYHSPLLWPPPETYKTMRGLAEQLLPGARYRRHLYWRYSLIWSKPA